MQDALLSNVEAVVFTSATLSAGDEFDYFKSRLGLADWPAVEAEQRIPRPSTFPPKCCWVFRTICPRLMSRPSTRRWPRH